MICPNCATENRESAKFCDECGFPLTGTIAHVAEKLEAISSAETAELPIKPLIDDCQDVEDPEGLLGAGNDIGAEKDSFEGDLAVEGIEDTALIIEEDEDIKDGNDDDEAISEEGLIDGIALEDGWPDEYSYKTGSIPDVQEDRKPDLSGLDAMPMEDEFEERFIPESQIATKPSWRDGATIEMPKIEGSDAPKRTAYRASTNAPKSNKKKIVIGVIAALAAIAAVVAFATYQMEIWGGRSVPSVVNMTQAEAESMLTEQGFKVRAEQVKSDDTEGLVLIVDPGVGSRVNENDEVVIHVASARVIPAIVGRTEEQAASLLALEDLSNVVFVKQKSDAPVGSVLSVSPEPGTRVKSATEVVVTVAEPFVVPDISGQYLDEAMETIQEAGLSPWVYYVYTTDYPDNTIIGTDPSKGTIVSEDAPVAILVARARGAELEEAAKGVIYDGATLSQGMYNYRIDSVGALTFQGNDTVAYTATATPYVVVFGQTVWGAQETITGHIVFDDDNNVVSIS